MRSITLCFAAVLLGHLTQAQNIGVNTTGGTPNASAMLDIDATNRGLLIPRVALTATNAAGPVTTPANSLLVYNTATAGTAPNNVTPGYYYWETTPAPGRWLPILSGVKGWTTTGNAGTVAGTNFIGTIDAQDFVVKTGGVAATNERMRVLSSGPSVVNRATAAAGDVFSVYATGTGGLSNLGDYAVNGYTNTGYGIFGQAANVSGIGVVAVNNVATGNSVGLWSEVASRNGTGLVGAANTSAAQIQNGTQAVGVQGQVQGTLAASGRAIGVFGVTPTTMSTGDANGVWGQSGSSDGTGVVGIATSTTINGQPTGVYGQANNATGLAIWGINGNVNGTGAILTGNNTGSNFLAAGSGAVFNGTKVGGLGFGNSALALNGGIGLVGVGNGAATPIYTPAQGGGVVGTGKQYGVIGFATNVTNTNPLNNNASAGANAAAGGYFEVQNTAGTAQTWSYVGVRDNSGTLRKIIGPGSVNTIVKDMEGKLVALSAPEAPENLFQDYGQGRLVNGKAHVQLDPILAKNIVVDADHPLRVFIQLEGECNGVYVTNKTGNSFDVVELQGGTSNTPFMWTVVANRADEVLPDGSISRYSAERFPAAPGPVEKERQELKELRATPKSPAKEAGIRPRKETGGK